MGERFEEFVRSSFRSAGRQYEEARRAYREARETTGSAPKALPRDREGRVRIVCRLHAEKRAVTLDGDLRPACFDPGRPDCRGCAEDVRDGVVETWEE